MMRLLGLALLAAAAGATEPIPSELFGALFVAVETAPLFNDSKTFCDAVPLAAPAAIMDAYRSYSGPLDDFVHRYFALPQAPKISPPVANQTISEHIAWLWPKLARPGFSDSNSSALPLVNDYVVPGGRFREIYYWDSFFTMLGLRNDGFDNLVQDMLLDLGSMITSYGHIPNGARNYYLSRSQPPFFALMVSHFASDPASWMPLVQKEYDFWMAGPRVAEMPDGSLLNHYWDDLNIPRDESYLEDVTTGNKTSFKGIFREIRAGAESGWDFSSRWMMGSTMDTMRATRVIPVDLNSLLYGYELMLGKTTAAAQRKLAIQKYLFNGRFFCDFNTTSMQESEQITAAAAYPLFFNISSASQARSTANALRLYLLEAGGLATTNISSGQQWDSPNGWAPLQYMAVMGLENYGESQLAETIAKRFLAVVEKVYNQTGKLVEKYNVVQPGGGGGGEYQTQDGFGWTNGVYSVLKSRFVSSHSS